MDEYWYPGPPPIESIYLLSTIGTKLSLGGLEKVDYVGQAPHPRIAHIAGNLLYI